MQVVLQANLHKKRKKIQKEKSIRSYILSDYFYIQMPTGTFRGTYCRLTIIVLWAFIPIILDFLDQQESSRLLRVVSKLTEVAKAAFI